MNQNKIDSKNFQIAWFVFSFIVVVGTIKPLYWVVSIVPMLLVVGITFILAVQDYDPKLVKQAEEEATEANPITNGGRWLSVITQTILVIVFCSNGWVWTAAAEAILLCFGIAKWGFPKFDV